MLPNNVAEKLCWEFNFFASFKSNEYLNKQILCVFYKNLSLTVYKKQTRQLIKVHRHGFLDQGVKKV